MFRWHIPWKRKIFLFCLYKTEQASVFTHSTFLLLGTTSYENSCYHDDNNNY